MRPLASTLALSGLLVLLLVHCRQAESKPVEAGRLTSVTLAQLKSRLAAQKRVTVLNVWSTWCGPCVEEMPDLVKLRTRIQKRGADLVLVSVDAEDERADAVKVLQERGVSFESFIKSGPDAEFIRGIHPKWSGTLPFTVLYDAGGKEMGRWVGKAPISEIEKKISNGASKPR